MAQQPRKLLVLDIDNTVFDWVTYYVHSMESLFSTVSDIVGTSSTQLANEAKQVFTEHGSIEYPFLIQELPSVIEFYSGRIEQMLKEAVEPGREAFNRAAQKPSNALRGRSKHAKSHSTTMAWTACYRFNGRAALRSHVEVKQIRSAS